MVKKFEAVPSTNLNDIFKLYYYCAFEQSKANRNTGVVVEDGLYEICFLKEHDIFLDANGTHIQLPKIFIIGKVDLPSGFIIPNTISYITLKIQPWAASLFVEKNFEWIQDLSKSKFENIQLLHERLFCANSFEVQVALIERYFLSLNLSLVGDFKISKDICHYIYANKGNIKIKGLLELFPYSRQKLNQVFLSHTQNSIKEFAVYVRLRSIMSYCVQYPEVSLTSAAYKFGYFDQSHFIKDLKKVTGMTPNEFTKNTNFFFEQLKQHA